MTAPLPDGPVVVEGWGSRKCLQAAQAEYARHGSPVLYVTGGPIDEDSPLLDYSTFAELGASQLQRLGFTPETVQAVPAPAVRRDRTYTSAVALREWLAQHGRVPAHLTVVSAGAHARRTRLMFQQAFGPGTLVGIIAVPSSAFPQERWWAYSQGFREVTDEAVAYLYARLFFWRMGGGGR